VTVALAVAAADVAGALTIAWDAFTDAAGGDLAGWDVTAAAAEVQPGPELTGADVRPARIGLVGRRAEPQHAGHQVVIHFYVAGQGQHVPAFLAGAGARVLGFRRAVTYELAVHQLEQPLCNRRIARKRQRLG
jgi:hypothetical protein